MYEQIVPKHSGAEEDESDEISSKLPPSRAKYDRTKKNRKQISINRVENIWKQENNAGQLNTLEITCRNKNVLKKFT